MKGRNMITTHDMKKMIGKAVVTGGVALVGLGLATGTAQAFNPQPDPPGKPIAIAVNPPDTSRGGIIAVNPQPERPNLAIHGG
jgi:hypothetical protein